MASRSQRAGALLLSACVVALVSTRAGAAEEPPHPASLDEAIIKSAARHGIPESLVRRIVMRESKYNPLARNHKYWGLMQISYPTAKSMGFRGTPQELLNPVVNLRYAVPYLANAFIIAGKQQDQAVRLYAAGYYDTAKRRGLLGMLRTADSKPLSGVPDEPDQIATLAPPAPPPAQDTGIFGALFGPRQMTREEQPQVASADPSQPVAMPQPTAPATSAPIATIRTASTMDKATDDVALVADKHGNLQPPKKWLHDGGRSTIARGEQPVDRVAAFQGDAGKDTRGRHHKTTLFAAIDAQPASAQAYAGPQDQRLMQADSQAAIAQATAGQPMPQQPQAAAQQPATALAATKAADEDSSSKGRKHHARRSRHKDTPDDAVAQAPAPAAQQTAPETSPQGAAMAPAQPQQAATEPQPQGDGQPRPALDASGYPADVGARPADAADAAPAKPKRHVAHRAHPHKTAVAAAQDDKAQPAPAPQ